MSSFADFLTTLRDGIKNDTTLQAFSTAAWNKALGVKITYKKRLEVNISELPVLLITRPHSVKKWIIGARDASNTVRIYGLFHQKDAEQGGLELIRFEEEVDDFIDRFSLTAPTGMIDIIPGESANDEGQLAPTYAFIQEIEVKFRR